ncbi:DUF378 domain-containing protein [bacterium]|nr:DUF378 domain-containing protein [bacterium]
MNKNKGLILKNIIFSITLIGAINWGIVGFFDFEVFSFMLGANSIPCKIIYIIIGLSALSSATFAVIDCSYCNVLFKRK